MLQTHLHLNLAGFNLYPANVDFRASS